MSELTYKVWDTARGEWAEEGDFVLAANGVVRLVDNQYRCNFYYDGYRKTKTIVVRSTGLKDKNGVEIFEGDLMGSGKVVWNEKKAAFVLLGKDWEHDMNYAANNYTVSGNTYEIEKIFPIE